MLSLDNDALSALVAAVDEGDLLPLALTCTTLRDACVVHVSAQLEPGDRVELVGIASEPVPLGRWLCRGASVGALQDCICNERSACKGCKKRDATARGAQDVCIGGVGRRPM